MQGILLLLIMRNERQAGAQSSFHSAQYIGFYGSGDMSKKKFRSFVFLPGASKAEVLGTAPPFALNGITWAVDESASLGGVFYDYIRDDAGQIAGIRYWIGNGGVSPHEFAFQGFLADPRFLCSPCNTFVDMLFDERFVALFESGVLTVDDAQDFGYDFVLKSETGVTAICISTDID